MNIKIILGLPSVVMMFLLGSNLNNAGVFKTIKPHFTGQYDQIVGMLGPEDITFIPNENSVLVSSYDRSMEAEDASQSIGGGIFQYNLDTQKFNKISPDMEDFRPHGFSLYKMDNGETRLFVINHAGKQQTVDVFSLKQNKLTLLRSIQSEKLNSPNDIVAVGPEQFYATNDHHYSSGIMHVLENYLTLPISNVMYFDGEDYKQVASGISFANGINVSANGKQLYLASLTSLKIYVYQRDLGSNELSLLKKIDTQTGVDNIELDENGDLWIGSHPQLLKLAGYAKDSKARSPSQVLKIKVSDGSFEVESVYLNNGDPIAGSSVAAVKGNRMLIGSVFDNKILDCTFNNNGF